MLVEERAGGPNVAGLPPAVRAAYRAAQELAPCRIVAVTADGRFAERWRTQLTADGVSLSAVPPTDARTLDPEAPLLAVDPEGFPDAGLLESFAEGASGRDARALSDGRPVLALRARAGSVGGGAEPASETLRKALAAAGAEVQGAGAWLAADTPAAASRSASVLYSRLGNPKDGYIAKFDRALSILLTRMMLPFPVSPNAVTTLSLLVGLWGAWELAGWTRSQHFLGAFLLWVCALLDGCDGEIARLKHMSSPSGAAYDVAADHVAHLATFIALPVGVSRVHPGQDWLIPGVLLVSGFIACGYSVWKLVLSVPEERRGPLALTVERIASRDYIYLILPLTAIGHLDWFVWAAAVGSHVFWMWLWWQASRLKTA